MSWRLLLSHICVVKLEYEVFVVVVVDLFMQDDSITYNKGQCDSVKYFFKGLNLTEGRG